MCISIATTNTVCTYKLTYKYISVLNSSNSNTTNTIRTSEEEASTVVLTDEGVSIEESIVAAALMRVVEVGADAVEVATVDAGSVDALVFVDALVVVDPPWGTPKTPLLLAVARAVLLRVGIVTASMALRHSAATLMVL